MVVTLHLLSPLLNIDFQTPIAPNVHPKLNTGKEPFQCGMANAECGIRNAPVFAPVFTALRRGELLRCGKECGVRNGKSADYADFTDFFSSICVIREICG
jgi:hypothetical protein